MSDTPLTVTSEGDPGEAPPPPGDNQPPIAKLAEEMTHHASLWASNSAKGDKHTREIMVCAYRLRLHAEDPELRLSIKGLLADAKVPATKRSDLFTQLLHYAYHKANVQPEKSQLSRCAGALRHAWSHKPRPAPDDVLAFIKREGGDVACARKARDADRQAAKAASGGDAANDAPQPIPITCELPADILADGKTSIAGRIEKSASGAWQFVPRKVVSRETTPAEPATASP